MRVSALAVVLVALLIAIPSLAVDDFAQPGNAPAGSSGAEAIAEAISPDAANRAVAAGGLAGSATAAAPDGLSGGSATATAATDAAGDASARASAFGGRSSRPFSLVDGVTGGNGGSATATADLRTTGGDGAVEAIADAEDGWSLGGLIATTGGQGGTATATATGDVTDGDLSSRATATAGNGGSGSAPAAGADATANATGTVSGTASALDVAASARGGAGGAFAPGPSEMGRSGDGGDATADAQGSADGNADVSVQAGAIAGAAGAAQGNAGSSTAKDNENDPGTSGDAIARASGSSSGSGDVDVVASAVGGAGGGAAEARTAGSAIRAAGTGGGAVATAHGSSTGGGDVRVRSFTTAGAGGTGLSGAAGGDGGDVHVVDSVTGETAGLLELEQFARGGRGGSAANQTGGRPALAGRGGSAYSELDATNPLGGALRITVESVGEWGGSASGAGIGGDGGSATLLANGTATNGASVEVIGTGRGGNGGAGTRGGTGADVALDNAVRGATTGALRLEQNAFGGAGGSGAVVSGTGDATGIVDGAGDGGSAASRLTPISSAASLDLAASATGGVGAGASGSSRAGRGGDAVAEARATNAAGSASATVAAVGASGGSGTAPFPATGVDGAAGGDAIATGEVETAGDGHDIDVDVRATGGAGGFGPAQGGAGGNANARAIGRAAGDSAVAAVASASAGVGGTATTSTGGQSGPVGRSDAYAEASNAGGASVLAAASATNGTAAARATSTGGGDATARAVMSSAVGPVVARDLVSGSTSGLLSLDQRVSAGSGDAIQELTAENAGGGDLRVDLTATGGTGAATGETRLDRLDLLSRTGALLDARVRLAAGSGRFGNATMPASAGQTAVLDDSNGLVRLDTSGVASLDLDILGGTGGVATSGGGSGGGSGGDARVALRDLQTTASKLTLDVDARGGAGGNGQVSTAAAGNGGRAEIDLVLASSTGSIDVALSARGGAGGTAGSSSLGGRGGDASVNVDVTTSGDGADISIGDLSNFQRLMPEIDGLPRGGAVASSGSLSRAAGGVSPDGGHAASSTRAVANGDSAVRIVDVAIGGSGSLVALPSGTSATHDGGRGGDAHSSAVGINHGASAVEVFAAAFSGSGGSVNTVSSTPSSGGDGGTATLGPVYGESTGGGSVHVIGMLGMGGGGRGSNAPIGSSMPGGASGRGQAVHLSNAVDGATSGALTLEQYAFGNSDDHNRFASSSRLDKTTDNRSLTLFTSAMGDGPARLGGLTLAESIARNQSGDVAARSRARGGFASDATASAVGEGFGEGRVDVVAESIGGDGDVELGGAGTLGEVRGISHGGGAVDVTGISRAGAGASASLNHASARSTDLHNAVSGATSGALTLRQIAEGGNGAESDLPIGGSASSVLDVDGSDANASLSLVAESIGGRGGDAYGPSIPAAGGNAESMANAINRTGNARATAIARGGETYNGLGGAARARATALALGNAGAWAEVHAGGAYDANSGVGAATIDAAYAESLAGGDVDVTAIVRGPGRGLDRDVSIANALDGKTTGRLALRQAAFGGVASSRTEGGSASSSLQRNETLASDLELRSQAIASDNTDFFPTNLEGTLAVSTIAGSSISGNAALYALGVGGSSYGGSGGEANVDVSFDIHAMSGDLTIGVRDLDLPALLALGPDTREFGAFGGNATNGSNGGDATSRSVGRSFGSGAVTVSDLAVGGKGGGPSPYTADRRSGDGGAATSFASAESTGKDVARSSARALGGDAGLVFAFPFQRPPIASVGGDATATAYAVGSDALDVTAWATAGRSRGDVGGSAVARASGEGASGSLVATAETSSRLLQNMSLSVSTEVVGSAALAADASVQFERTIASGADAAISGRALVQGAERAALESSHAGFAGSLATLGLDTIIADIDLAMSPGEGAGDHLSAAIDIAFDLTDTRAVSNLHLFLVDGTASGGEQAIDEVVLRVLQADSLLVERTMRSLASFTEAFTDEVIALGDGFDTVALGGQPAIGAPLRIELEWLSKGSGWTFAGKVLLAAANVPEPATGVLVSIGLAMLGLRRRAA